MKILQSSLVVVVLALCLGCTSASGPADGVEIRVANQSGVDFERLDVTFPSGKVEYGRLAAGAMSGYRRVEKAYRYAQVEAMRGGETLTLQPQDYMGETPLSPGHYTYTIGMDESGNTLTLDLIED